MLQSAKDKRGLFKGLITCFQHVDVMEWELKFCRCLPLSCFSEGFHISEHKSFIALTQCSVSHGLFIKWGVAVYHTANPAQHRYRLTAVCTLITRNKSLCSWATAGKTCLVHLTHAGRSREAMQSSALFI